MSKLVRLALSTVAAVLAATLTGPDRWAAPAAAQQDAAELAANVSPGSVLLLRPARLVVEAVPLYTALTDLQTRSGVSLVYSPSRLPLGQLVSCECFSATVDEALGRLLVATRLQYSAVDGHVLIEPVEGANPTLPSDLRRRVLLAHSPGGGRMADAHVRTVAQQGTLSGRVTDAGTGQPLAGAQVAVVSTQRGARTDEQGRFVVTDVPAGLQRVQATRLGYNQSTRSVTVTAGQGATLDFALAQAAVALEGIVAVGYGTVRKSDLTGSVSSISDDDFNQGTVASVDQLIQGRAAGVQVTQASGEPGGGTTIRIRGVSSVTSGSEPLYVIDGLPINNAVAVSNNGEKWPTNQTPRNPLNALSPSDIASIEILKDASAAAIYGSRGANGVILITTKRGRGTGLQFDYTTSVGTQEIARPVALLNTGEYIQVMNELETVRGNGPLFTGEEIQQIGAGTNWQNELSRRGMIQDHNLSLSGTSGGSSFFASFSYLDQTGVIVSSGFERLTGRVNLEHREGDRFRFGVNVNTTSIDDDYVPNGLGINQHAGAISPMLNVPPTFSVRDENGRYVVPSTVAFDNPLALAYGYDAVANTERTFGNAFGEYTLLPGLTARLNFGADRQAVIRDVYMSTETIEGGAAGGIATIASGNVSNALAEATLTYDRSFRDAHSLTALAGYTYENFDHKTFSAVTQGFPSDIIGTNNLGTGNDALDRVGSYLTNRRLRSYLGRVNYSHNDRYLLTASVRADGSSNFGENHRYGVFPSFALGWKLSEEPFMERVRFIDELKPRLSWGRIGNDQIGIGRALQTYSSQGYAVLGGQLAAAIGPARIANPGLKWETTEQINAGIDASFLDGRVYTTLDYFNKTTRDLLLDLPVPRATGFSFMTTNIGEVRNNGFEAMLETRNLVGEFGWDTNFTFATVSSEVVDLGPMPEIVMRQNDVDVIIRPGETPFAYYGYRADGIWQAGENPSGSAQPNAVPGIPKWRDVNRDGQITEEDRVSLGDPFPDLTFGFNNTFTFRGFDMRVFLEGARGVHLLNYLLVDALYPNSPHRNRLAEPLLNRWTAQNPTDRWPSNVDDTRYGGGPVNSFTVEDASFIRLKSVRLGYDVPVDRVHPSLRTATLFVTGQNLWLMTDYLGYDPDVNSKGDSNIRLDRNPYPAARTVSIGMSVGF